MPIHEKINYAEFPSKNLSASKSFFECVFGWEFTDYGSEYAAFSNQGLDEEEQKGTQEDCHTVCSHLLFQSTPDQPVGRRQLLRFQLFDSGLLQP